MFNSTALVELTGILMALGFWVFVVGGVAIVVRWVIVSAIRAWHEEKDISSALDQHRSHLIE